MSGTQRPVLSSQVRDDLVQISKAFTELGYADPRLDTYGHIDARLRYLLKGMNNVGPAANRVKPIPLQV
jgi:hypothetical protein